VTSITLRSVKGSPLTNNEVDSNFNSLNVYKVELTDSAGSIIVPAGTTAERDASPSNGYLRYNTETDKLEVYAGGSWSNIGELTSSISYNTSNGTLTLTTSDSSYSTVIDLQPFTTTNLMEGTNLYYTTARADSDAKNAVSVTDAGGDGSLSYNPGTGVFTYTGPSATETRAHFSGGANVIYDSSTGVFTLDSDISLTGDISARQFLSTNKSLAAPEAGNYSGERLRLYDFENPLKVNYAIGVETSAVWFSVDTNLPGQGWKWYGDSVEVARLNAVGDFNIIGDFTASSLSGNYLGFDSDFGSKTTDDLTEGSTNLYYDSARTITVARNSVSVTDAGGDGSLTYSAATGIITYTGPSAAEARAHFSGGTGVTINDGVIAIGQAVGAGDTPTFNGLSAGNAKITALLTPTDGTDAANKAYVDEVATGLAPAPSVNAATTANLDGTFDSDGTAVGYLGVGTLTATVNGAIGPIDDVSIDSGDSLLLKDQTTAFQNGRWNVSHAGDSNNPWVLIRCSQCDSSDEIPGKFIFITAGTLYANTGWVLTVTDPETFVINRDPIIPTQFSGAGAFTNGYGLNLNGTEFSLDSAETITLTRTGLSAGTGINYNSGTGVISYDSSTVVTTARNSIVSGTGITYTASTGTIATNDGAIVHDNLSGFVANEHIDHSAVTITAGSGLTGGGNITASRTLNIGQGTGITVSADAIATNDAQIVHDNLSGFVANEHIDHTTVSISAGTGLTGGGTIAANRTLSIANTGVAAATYGDSSTIPRITVNAQGQITAVVGASVSIPAGYDKTNFDSDFATKTTTNLTEGTNLYYTDTRARDALSGGTGITYTAGTGTIATNDNAIVHDNLSGFVADEHVAHSGVTITAGSGLTGGGTIAASRTINVGAGSYIIVNADDIAVDATSANTASKVVARDASGNFSAGTITAALTGNASTATTLQTARTIGGVSFNGSANINLPGVNTTGNQNTSGNAASATVASTVTLTADNSTNATNYPLFANAATGNLSPRTDTGLTYNPSTGVLTSTTFSGALSGNATTATTLQNARTIGGVSFNGSANINLPGVNTAGNQNTTGSAATLTTSRTIGGVSFNGSANINLPGVNIAGNQNTTGSAATLTTSRTLWGQSFNGSANVTGALSSVTTIAMSGQLTNTVTSGTAPFVVSSTTAVSNLNADLLDGQHGSYYRIDVYNSAGTLLN
jgi:hypothetical protein